MKRGRWGWGMGDESLEASTLPWRVCGYTPADCSIIKVAALIWQEGRSHRSKVRVRVGTRKGAFIPPLTQRKNWGGQWPHFADGRSSILMVLAANPDRLYCFAYQRPGPGQSATIRYGVQPGNVVATSSSTNGVAARNHGYDGTPHPLEFKRAWHLSPSGSPSQTHSTGVGWGGRRGDAAIFRSKEADMNLEEMSWLRKHGSGPHWQPGAGGMSCTGPSSSTRAKKRMYLAILVG